MQAKAMRREFSFLGIRLPDPDFDRAVGPKQARSDR